MSSRDTRGRLLRFALVFFPFFVLCVGVYPHVQPLYQEAVVAAIDVGLHRLDPPMRIEVNERGGWTTHAIQPDGTERFYWSRPGKKGRYLPNLPGIIPTGHLLPGVETSGSSRRGS